MFLTSLQPLTIKVQCTYHSETEKHMEKFNYINISCLFSICSLWPCFCPNLPKVLVFQGSHGTSTTSSIKVHNFLFILTAWQDVCIPVAVQWLQAEQWLVCGLKDVDVVGQATIGWALYLELILYRQGPTLTGKTPSLTQWPSEPLKWVSEGCQNPCRWAQEMIPAVMLSVWTTVDCSTQVRCLKLLKS